MGFLYLLHFERGLTTGRNSHYLGYAESDPERRIKAHRTGRGAVFAREAKAQGIAFVVAGIWPDMTTADERRIKRQKHHKRFCRPCLGDGARPFPPDASQRPQTARTAPETAETGKEAAEASGAAYGPPDDRIEPDPYDTDPEALYDWSRGGGYRPDDDEPPDRPDQSDVPMWHEMADDERYPGADWE